MIHVQADKANQATSGNKINPFSKEFDQTLSKQTIRKGMWW